VIFRMGCNNKDGTLRFGKTQPAVW
jgi:hypothetical protein